MMETEISERLALNSALTRLTAREDFKAFLFAVKASVLTFKVHALVATYLPESNEFCILFSA
jgi:hypothetical protein